MTRYYCDYCDTYLTHDSVRHTAICFGKRTEAIRQKLTAVIDLYTTPLTNFLCVQPVVRKQHNDGYKHKVGSERVKHLYST